jgi:DNA polymerase-3 subunit beta
VGEAQEEVESSSQGKEVEIIFNAYYLLGILNSMDSEEVLLELNDPLSPGVIRPVSEEDHLCVIMPMKP